MDLVYNGIYLKKPTYDELQYSKELWGCKKTMSFNDKWGGTVPFPKSMWQDFYNRYLIDTSKNVYFHIYNLDNTFVGEVSSRYLSDENTYTLNIKVKYEYRGNNHAFDALELYFTYLFNTIGANRIIDNVASDNIGAIKLLTHSGMTIIQEDDEIVLFELKKEDYI